VYSIGKTCFISFGLAAILCFRYNVFHFMWPSQNLPATSKLMSCKIAKQYYFSVGMGSCTIAFTFLVTITRIHCIFACVHEYIQSITKNCIFPPFYFWIHNIIKPSCLIELPMNHQLYTHMQGNGFPSVTADAVTVKDHPITIAWLKSF
jgi:hypothetical protein